MTAGTSEVISRALEGEHMKCKVAGRSRRVHRRSFGVSLRLGVVYLKLRITSACLLTYEKKRE